MGAKIAPKEMYVGGKLFGSNYCDEFLTREKFTYKCDVCEKRFSFRNKLKPHALADLGDPANRSKVPCRKCKIEFTNRATLRVHFRINTLVKRFLNVRNVTRHLQGLTT